MLFAHNLGLINFNPFGAYKLKFEYVEREYFEQDELNRIYQKTFASKQLEQVRDMFIFSYYIGLSYVDVCELRAENIKVSFDSNLWIIKKRHKTNVTSNIRLLDIPKAILQKYDGKLPDGKILPVINNQKVNDYLKEIATMCGINKKITYHVTSHNFATLSISYGIPIENVSKMLEHTKIRTTQMHKRIERRASDTLAFPARFV